MYKTKPALSPQGYKISTETIEEILENPLGETQQVVAKPIKLSSCRCWPSRGHVEVFPADRILNPPLDNFDVRLQQRQLKTSKHHIELCSVQKLNSLEGVSSKNLEHGAELLHAFCYELLMAHGLAALHNAHNGCID